MKPHLVYLTRYGWWVLYAHRGAPVWFSAHPSLKVLWNEWNYYVKGYVSC
jgi:hypothetical protein